MFSSGVIKNSKLIDKSPYITMNEHIEVTVFDAYYAYISNSQGKNQDKMLNTIFVRFLVPVWGEIIPKGKRALPSEITNALEFLKRQPISLLLDAPSVAEEEFLKQEISLSNRRTYRSILKGFVHWLQANNYFEKNPLAQINVNKESTKLQNGKVRFRQANNKAITNWGAPIRGWKKTNSFTLEAKDMKGNMVYPGDYMNDLLKKDLAEFKKFRELDNCVEDTIHINIEHCKRFLGWLHRYKGVPLEELRLKSIIPYCVLEPDLKNTKGHTDFTKYIMQQHKLKQEATNLARNAMALIEEFLNFTDIVARTKKLTLGSFKAVARFIYIDVIGTEQYLNEKDIPIIRLIDNLNGSLSKQVRSSTEKVPYSEKSIPWESALNCLERIRQEVETEVQLCGKPREGFSIMTSLQNFICLSFLTLLPPLRSQVYCNLELGNSLIQGIYISGIFVPKEKMLNPNEALWYIHLFFYKTSKSYGEWWGIVPNIQFIDGKLFYDYIDKWIKEGRNCNGLCNHNFFFRGVRNNKKLNSTLLNQRIQSMVFRITGINVTTREFRKMYVTFLKDSGATEAELEAAAMAMQHSREMQSKIYDKQNQLEKTAPMLLFNEKKIKEIFLKNSKLSGNNTAYEEIEKLSKKLFTRLKLLRTQAVEEINRLRQMNMNDEKIIQFLWDATPKTREKYQNAIAEFEELIKG